MQHIKNIILFTSFCLLAGCSDDFLNENPTPVTLPMGYSNIYMSPDWESSYYAFMLPSVHEVAYEITSKPSWLNIDTGDGHLSDSIAIVECSARLNPDFEEVGFYMEFMTVKADGKSFKVPVAYITEGNPKIQVQDALAISYNSNGYSGLEIKNTGPGILLWEIASMPSWLYIDGYRLESNTIYIPPYKTFYLPLVIIPVEVITGAMTGDIVIYTNDKERPSVTINITADLGTPRSDIDITEFGFSYTETSKTLILNNYGNGILAWEFKGLPEWLTITPSSGMIGPYAKNNKIIFTCDRTKLKHGLNSATLILNTNDISNPSYNIEVTANAPADPENIRAVNGNITDAVFNKNANTLYFVTSSPDKFVAYDITGRTVLNEISLSDAPTSFAISEDWSMAAVGHNGYISAINLSTNTVTATYTLNYPVNDIAWAENDWFCFTQAGTDFTCLHWINTSDGTMYDDTDASRLDGNSIIKKVPGQPYLIATRNNTDPTGFFAYDIATKSLKSYSRQDLTNFWFSEDGNYIFAKSTLVFRTTSSTGSTDTNDAEFVSVNYISSGGTHSEGIKFIYHSNGYLWVLQNKISQSGSTTGIFQVEDTRYKQVKECYYDIVCQPDGQTTPIEINAEYVFANKEGTEIAVLCKSVSSDLWVIQFVDVQ